MLNVFVILHVSVIQGCRTLHWQVKLSRFILLHPNSTSTPVGSDKVIIFFFKYYLSVSSKWNCAVNESFGFSLLHSLESVPTLGPKIGIRQETVLYLETHGRYIHCKDRGIDCS